MKTADEHGVPPGNTQVTEQQATDQTVPDRQTGSSVPCVHCGLPSPRPRRESDPAFCCNGCRGAWHLIHGWGLQDYYSLRDCNPTEAFADNKRNTFEDLDDPQLLLPSVVKMVPGPNGMQLARVRLSISGLHCAACSWLIEQAPKHVIGWYSAEVQMHSRSVELVYDTAVVRLSEIARILNQIGYFVSPYDPSNDNDANDQESRRLLMFVAIAGFCATNAMWIAVALYAGSFSGIAVAHRDLLLFFGVGLGVVAVFVPGQVFLRGAWASLRMRVPHMDLPIAVGLLAGAIGSVYGLVVTESDVYFDSIATLVFFLLIGRWIQLRQQHHAGRSIAAALNLVPSAATRIDRDGVATRVAAAELQLGDVVRVGPGESIPVDGEVIEGHSFVDRSLLTGESRPVAVDPGSMAEAGTDNLETEIRIRATATGEATRLGELSQTVAHAAASKTPIVQLANRIGGWFVTVILGLAIMTAAYWWHVSPSLAINHSIALLIVACPCALAMATPLAIAVSIGRLAQRRILVRSGESLEQLAQPGTIFFDKTGTLTEGRMQVTDWFGDDHSLANAAALEVTVQHPIARAIVQFANANPVRINTAVDVRNRMGVGVTGTIDGQTFAIGGAKLLENRHVFCDASHQANIDAVLRAGSTPIVLLRGDRVAGVFGVSDPIRSDAAQVVQQMRAGGWRVAILSGDHPQIVRDVAKALGVADLDALGDQSPEQKLAAIEQAKQPCQNGSSRSRRGSVVMVGDGVNDAAALAAADIGVALRGGANASLAAAPIVIGNGQLSGIVALVQTAKRTSKCIRQNFVISISYNAIAAVLAITGVINPLIAAVLMPISSLSVLTMTLAMPAVPNNTRLSQRRGLTHSEQAVNQ